MDPQAGAGPSRRSVLCCGSAMATLALLGCSPSAKTDARPNIVLFLTDDMRADAIEKFGPGYVPTPALDSFADEGVAYSDALVTTSICATSRASILTGQYARRHQFWWRASDTHDSIIADSFTTKLRDSGYRTAYFGKWGVGRYLPENAFDVQSMVRGNEPYTRPDRETHLTRWLADSAVDFIRESHSPPFCMIVATKAPHAVDGAKRQFPPDPAFTDENKANTIALAPSVSNAAYEALPSFLRDSEGRVRWQQRFGNDDIARQSRQDYYNLVRGIDDAFGRVVDALKAADLYDNTLVIFTSDNGMMLGEHGLSGKWWMFEESVRIPFIIKAPQAFSGALDGNNTALNIDIHPTIMSVAGIAPSDAVQGRNLFDAPQRDAVFYEHMFEWGPVSIAKSEGIRTARYSYMVYPEEQASDGSGKAEMLFDRLSDPYQMNNLANDPTSLELLENMRQRREAALAEISR